MIVSIISIGDELLIGQTVNTNASWLGRELSLLGARIKEVITISDDEHAIRKAIDHSECDLCLVTGGLGPTKDDRTKKVLAEYFEMPLVLHEPTFQHIALFFERRNRPMLQGNRDQAMLPKGCEILPNILGTAAGMWLEAKGKSVISLPGVPYEMKEIFKTEIVPRLHQRFALNALYHRTILTQGMGESFLSERLADWETSLENAGLSLAYLPSPGMVKLRIGSYRGKQDEALIQDKIMALNTIIPELIVGYGEDTVASVVGKKLIHLGASLGTVESCTAGNLAAKIIEVPGSSAYFRGSLLTYQTALKTELLSISSTFITKHDVVSEAVAKEMAAEGRRRLNVDYCLSTTGIMGPSKGDSLHPVGTVWVGLASADEVIAKCFTFGENRERNIEMASLYALNTLRLFIQPKAQT